MRFGAHYLPTYVPDLDGPVTEFYRRMFEQMEEVTAKEAGGQGHAH